MADRVVHHGAKELSRELCDDCGYDDLNCECSGLFPEDFECTHCGGEGTEWGYEKAGDFGWYDPNKLYPCFACNGSGSRKDQWFF